MKKFILKTAIFSLPIVILAISMEYILQQIPNNLSCKKEYLDHHSENIQMLIFGNSHTYYGINPDHFSQHAFNVAYNSQTLNLDFEIFEMYNKKFDNLKVIILPISYSTLWSTTERAKDYTLYYGINANCPTDYSEILNNRFAINVSRLRKHFSERKDDISCSSLGWGTNFSSEHAGDLEATGQHAAFRHTYRNLNSKENATVFAKNVDILHSFAEWSSQNNVKLIFLTVPVYRTYRENLNEIQLKKMIETITNLATQYENSSYINWLEHTDFVTGDFYDADHLNEIGAKKLSLKLANVIDSLGILF
jgi:hypothetical protein